MIENYPTPDDNAANQAFFDIVGSLWKPASRMKAAMEDPAIIAAHDYYMYSQDGSALADLAALAYQINDVHSLGELTSRLTWRWALEHGQGKQAKIDEEAGITHG